MRNPNGYGSVVKLSGNRRRPFMVRVTVGWNDKGQPIYKILDYFAKREDALICLANYNDAPYSVDYRRITFSALFDKLKEIKYPAMTETLRYTLNAAYKYCEPLYKLQYRSIKAFQMQACIDRCPKSYATKTNIKNLFYHLDRLAFELDVISKQYSEVLTVPQATPKQRTLFTDEEVRALWERQEEPGVEECLFMLYTGMRISEVMALRTADVNLEDGYVTGGSKSEAGKNRIVPIHARILPIVAKRMGGSMVFDDKDFKRQFSARFPGHTSHDCRHTFRSKLDSAGANKTAIDLIMGHRSPGIGERVYTHKTIEELKNAVALLEY